MDQAVRRHCEQIARCQQRGGRMLSVVDLIQAGTLTPDLAAYAWARIGRGASFLVGATPGGAGKTTVMGALLGFVPPGVELFAADGMGSIELGLEEPCPRRCWVCHEIGPGPYYAYLWGAELRHYLALGERGHMLASNLHADTLAQTREQLCAHNFVPPEQFRTLGLLLFLRVEQVAGATLRRVAEVWESDGENPHLRVYPSNGQGLDSALLSPADLSDARRELDGLLASGARRIEEVREWVVRQAGW